MTIIESFILGLMQGLTEFLPVSSSAHLKLAKIFFGLESSESLVIFDLVCHLGTLVAVLYFFRSQIFSLLTTERRKLLLIIIGTLPLVPFYFLLKPLREFASAPEFLGLCLMGTGCILFLGEFWRLKIASTNPRKKEIKDALWIGALQATALIPGISRSASTISCAQVLGWQPKDAVTFSFLLSIPTVIGGNTLELLKLSLSSAPHTTIPFLPCIIGFVTSMVVGCVMIRVAMTILERGKLKPFAWYCLSLGLCTTLYLNLF